MAKKYVTAENSGMYLPDVPTIGPDYELSNRCPNCDGKLPRLNHAEIAECRNCGIYWVAYGNGMREVHGDVYGYVAVS